MSALYRPRRLRDPRVVPTEPVEVDWTHPLAAGLQNFLIFADGPDLGLTPTSLSPVGSPGLVTSAFGLAQNFDGATQYLEMTSKTVDSAPGSVVWQQSSAVAYNSGTIRGMWGNDAGSATIQLSAQVYSDNNWYVGWDASGDQRVVVAASAANFPQNVMTRYAFTWDNGESTLYQGATVLGSNATAPVIQIRTSPFFIGTYSGVNPTATLFSGMMTHLAIFARALSASEVAWLYAEPFAMLRPRR